MIYQTELKLPAMKRGFHLIDEHVLSGLQGRLPEAGICHIFIRHTSAALAINENADPSVRHDLNNIFNELVPEHQPYYTHTMEGPDDMPSHAKAILAGSSVTIPVTNGSLNLGTWQGIYLCEFRDHGGPRKLVITIYS
jgi:secondary thiamine-phosphate synthase enzyme